MDPRDGFPKVKRVKEVSEERGESFTVQFSLYMFLYRC
jgi:hypothetical protein